MYCGSLRAAVRFTVRGRLCKALASPTLAAMFRWLIVVFLALLLLNGFSALLRKIGLGRLPGDFEITVFGRKIWLPIATTVVLSMLAAGIARYL